MAGNVVVVTRIELSSYLTTWTMCYDMTYPWVAGITLNPAEDKLAVITMKNNGSQQDNNIFEGRNLFTLRFLSAETGLLQGTDIKLNFPGGEKYVTYSDSMHWDTSDNLFIAFMLLGQRSYAQVSDGVYAEREVIVKIDASDLVSPTVSSIKENLDNFGRSACLTAKPTATASDGFYLGGSINDGHEKPSDPIKWSPSIKYLDSDLNILGSWQLRLGATTEDYSGAPDFDGAKHTYVDHVNTVQSSPGSHYLVGTTRSSDVVNPGSRIFIWKA